MDGMSSSSVRVMPPRGVPAQTRIRRLHSRTMPKSEGIDVAAGTYGLFFVIHPDNTGEAILSRNNKSWGSFYYDQAEDMLRTKIK